MYSGKGINVKAITPTVAVTRWPKKIFLGWIYIAQIFFDFLHETMVPLPAGRDLIGPLQIDV